MRVRSDLLQAAGKVLIQQPGPQAGQIPDQRQKRNGIIHDRFG